MTNTGELIGLDHEEVDQVMGLFSNNHMSYESIRDKGSGDKQLKIAKTVHKIFLLQKENPRLLK